MVDPHSPWWWWPVAIGEAGAAAGLAALGAFIAHPWGVLMALLGAMLLALRIWDMALAVRIKHAILRGRLQPLPELVEADDGAPRPPLRDPE